MVLRVPAKKTMALVLLAALCISPLPAGGAPFAGQDISKNALAVESDIQRIGEDIAKDSDTPELLFGRRFVQQLGIHDSIDVVFKKEELAKRGVRCLARVDDNLREAVYLFGKNGVILRITPKEVPAEDDLYQLFRARGMHGKKEVFEKDAFEWFYCPDRETVDLVNIFLRQVDMNWAIAPSAVSRKRLELVTPRAFQSHLSVALVSLGSPKHYALWNELSTETLAGDLRGYFGNRVDVSIQRTIKSDEIPKILHQIKEQQPDVIGVSMQLGSLALLHALWEGLRATEYYKKKKPLIVCGNQIPTHAPMEALAEFPGFIMAKGEGEKTMRDLTVYAGKRKDQLEEIAEILKRINLERPNTILVSGPIESAYLADAFMQGLRAMRYYWGGVDYYKKRELPKVPPVRVVFQGQFPDHVTHELLARYPEIIVAQKGGELTGKGMDVSLTEGKSLKDIDNLVYREGSQTVETRETPLKLVDCIFPPSNDTVREIVLRGGNVMIQASRGCSHGACVYCTRSSFRRCGKVKRGAKPFSWEGFPVTRVLEVLDRLVSMGITEVEFADDEFFGGRDRAHLKRIEMLVKGIGKIRKKYDVDLTFRVFSRPGIVFRENDEENARRVTRPEELRDFLARHENKYRYDKASERLFIYGVMTDEEKRELETCVTDRRDQQAVRDLYDWSRTVEPIGEKLSKNDALQAFVHRYPDKYRYDDAAGMLIVEGVITDKEVAELRLCYDTTAVQNLNAIEMLSSRSLERTSGNLRMTRIITRLKEVGCVKVYIGVEAGNDLQLMRYGRAVTAQQTRKALRTIKWLLGERGLDVGFMMFYPDLTLDEMEQNLKFFKEENLVPYNQWPYRPLVVNEGSWYKEILLRKKTSERMPQTDDLAAFLRYYGNRYAYDARSGELIVSGRVTEEEKQGLLGCFQTQDGKDAVERLYQNSTRGTLDPSSFDLDFIGYEYSFTHEYMDKIYKIMMKVAKPTVVLYYTLKVKSKKYFDPRKKDNETELAQYYVEQEANIMFYLMEELVSAFKMLEEGKISTDQLNEALRGMISFAQESLVELSWRVANDIVAGRLLDDDGFMERGLKEFGIDMATIRKEVRRPVEEKEGAPLMRFAVDNKGKIGAAETVGDMQQWMGLLGTSDATKIPSLVKGKIQQLLTAIGRRNYATAFGVAKEIVLVEKLSTMDKEFETKLGIYLEDGRILMDVHLFGNELALAHGLRYVLWESVLKKTEPENALLCEMTALYQVLKDFSRWKKEDQESLVTFLSSPENPLQNKGYAQLLDHIAQFKRRGRDLILLSIIYFMRQATFKYACGIFGRTLATFVEQSEQKHKMAVKIYEDLAQAARSRELASDEKSVKDILSAETKARAIKDAGIIAANISSRQAGLVNQLTMEGGRYVVLDAAKLKGNSGVINWLKNTLQNEQFSEARRSPFVLISSDIGYPPERFVADYYMDGSKFTKLENLAGVPRSNIIELVHLRDALIAPIPKDRLILPLFHAVPNIYIALRLALTGGDSEALKNTDNIAYESLISLYQAVYGQQFTYKTLSGILSGRFPEKPADMPMLADLQGKISAMPVMLDESPLNMVRGYTRCLAALKMPKSERQHLDLDAMTHDLNLSVAQKQALVSALLMSSPQGDWFESYNLPPYFRQPEMHRTLTYLMDPVHAGRPVVGPRGGRLPNIFYVDLISPERKLVAVFNTEGAYANVNLVFSELGLDPGGAYRVKDLWSEKKDNLLGSEADKHRIVGNFMFYGMPPGGAMLVEIETSSVTPPKVSEEIEEILNGDRLGDAAA